MFNLNKTKKQKNGFSILEIITAIFIIVTGLVGIMSLVIQNIQIQYINKNNLIASQLAQEGLELIRNKRDNNWLNGIDWNDDLTAGYYINDYTRDINNVSGMEEARLQLKDDAGEELYLHDTDEPDSNFSRLITITESDTEHINVSCRIEWQDRGNTYNYVADTVLYNWR